ncbi:glycosyltransferase [Zunongwangia endophytica]|uniref:Glycosyltransferase n=1 Tax=Zunongwangia endophytica TaxID=1808945 RepID=A0ABV8H5H2_9FLAO|nr:glycosyltransferase [Zunongwangia endophytica]MDN3595142.1 glycosyltransferase [Zunongwangia endophytica]
MNREYSFIVPVYNRPEETRELLQSMTALNFNRDFEVVIVEDGSSHTSKEIIKEFEGTLHISYYFKDNSGPGKSRNYGMQRAKGNYFLILDSDVILPEDYLTQVDNGLEKNYCDCFGGPDGAHKTFSDIQKAIDFSMTSFLTTGGIRGGKKAVNKFQPRSFNMGLSKQAFKATGGFGSIHPGEDPDLSLRLEKLNFTTCLIPKAVVFHKRRIDWEKFYSQVYKFGLTRPILNRWHKGSGKITYWFPSVFITGFVISSLATRLDIWWMLGLYVFYFLVLFFMASIKTKSLKIGSLAVIATIIQFFGYGYGFLKSSYTMLIRKTDPEEAYPGLFFKDA